LVKFRIAIATNGKDGLEDVVSNVFGRAKTFTIVDVEEGEIKNSSILENPGRSYKYGAGPIVTKMLVDEGVNLVLAYVVGRGAEGLLKQHKIEHVPIKPNIKVETAVREVIQKNKKYVENIYS
jgi:predicted Fe-Mo cluster-binding NifX family protein